MNRYGQIKDLILGDLSISIFIFGIFVTLMVILFFITSAKEKQTVEREYYDRYGSNPK
jgi:hypothetical protein